MSDFHSLRRRAISVAAVSLVAVFGSLGLAAETLPKEGLLIPKGKAAETRRWVLSLRNEPLIDGSHGIRTVADRAVAEWPATRASVEAHVPKMLDLLHESNRPEVASPEVREASKKLGEAFDDIAFLGFLYFLTADKKYSDTAYEILDMAGRVPRWGWFNWDGSHMPQIHYGQYVRTAAFCLDFSWDGWNAAQRDRAARIVAEKGVESYWRIVSLPPFMALHHLRAKNQGNNALAAALIASVAVGDSVPDNRIWFDSLLQTYCWIIAHDIGWAATNLESGLDGYWTVSIQNLYTAAATLHNARGIDLRAHPAFAEATWYPIMHEATVGTRDASFSKPYPKDEVGLWGTIEHKPIELPSRPGGSAWWYDYAASFPDSPASYFISRTVGGRLSGAHQRGHAEILNLLWVRRAMAPAAPPKPTLLFKAIDREAMFRSGYGSPHTFLSFNGDLFLSARNEILGCTGGLAWHFPWHQYAVTESVLETEGHPFSPSMQIYDSFDSPVASLIRTRSAASNVKYYRRAGQARSHLDYRERTRDIVYVRSDDRDAVHDYFLFVDRVRHDEPKWHSFNWHIWSRPGNEGKYERIDDRTVVARRPNASLLLATLSHDRVSYEERAIPSQPNVSYVFDHNSRLLRGIAGGSTKVESAPIVIPAKLWSDATPVRIDGRDAVLITDPLGKSPKARSAIALVPDCRYEVKLSACKEHGRIYENFAWTIDLKLLDAAGRTLLDVSEAVEDRAPAALRLSDPSSNEASYSDWRTTTTHFTAPAGVAAIEATLRPAQYGHSSKLTPETKFTLSDLMLIPLGIPYRTADDLLVTLAMPLENDAPLPKYAACRTGGRIEAEIVHPSGARDRVIVERDGKAEVVRTAAGERRSLGIGVRRLEPGSVTTSESVNAAFLERAGRLTGDVATSRRTETSIAGRSQTIEPGIYRYDGKLAPNLAAESLHTNTAANQRLLREGLKSLADTAKSERDRYVLQGWKNVARDAVEVTASAIRDVRFDARHVIDDKTWEMPLDGVVDYTLGNITTMQNGGYGRGATPYETDLAEWPLYIRPTYWLLPMRKTGDLTLRLKEPTKIKLVRLLNTTNAGLNDFATTECWLEFLGATSDTPVWSRRATFGKAWDHAFDAAFARPDYFASYGESFRGMLERGTRVPFGTGWVEVPVDYDEPVARVRIRIGEFWAGGGGLNEVQIYAR